MGRKTEKQSIRFSGAFSRGPARRTARAADQRQQSTRDWAEKRRSKASVFQERSVAGPHEEQHAQRIKDSNPQEMGRKTEKQSIRFSGAFSRGPARRTARAADQRQQSTRDGQKNGEAEHPFFRNLRKVRGCSERSGATTPKGKRNEGGGGCLHERGSHDNGAGRTNWRSGAFAFIPGFSLWKK
ncbi:hypothetical protein HUB98_06990 [Paenibacillus barcinonensis]|uniref:Uncharacterized protein n=1 Tax=Paenibacillus barcinonensis TaxID=198119 RepID=A0ABX6Q210_PAEBA|nr:hypothetical protein [Paenibacillus barcinonensis]QKS56117.1 hypothetical protein HUB98_06990 [Paenibacillus barcinonensis]